jgi:hypothetical protein
MSGVVRADAGLAFGAFVMSEIQFGCGFDLPPMVAFEPQNATALLAGPDPRPLWRLINIFVGSFVTTFTKKLLTLLFR